MEICFTDISQEKPEPSLIPFVPEFLNDRLTELNHIKSYNQEQKTEEILKIIHTWKGFSAPYGFQALGKISSQMHAELRENPAVDLDKFIEQVEKYLVEKQQILSNEKH